jgi:hypothetical protein
MPRGQFGQLTSRPTTCVSATAESGVVVDGIARETTVALLASTTDSKVARACPRKLSLMALSGRVAWSLRE